MRKLVFVSVLLAGTVHASPRLISDPYPLTGPQPTEFVINLVGTTTPVVVPAAKSPAGEAFFEWDLAGQTGQKTLTVKARNAWGESPWSPPFAYVAGVPVSPSGLTLAP